MRTFGPALGDDQAGFDRFSEADLIGEDAAAFAKAPQGEDDRVNLVRIWIDARLPLRRGVSFPVVGPPGSN